VDIPPARSLAQNLVDIAREKDAVSVVVHRNGPYLLRGSFTILDAAGEPLPQIRRTVALCRCGRSRSKPLCDGSHKAGRDWDGPGAQPTSCSPVAGAAAARSDEDPPAHDARR
jgi:CDGSH-type Zn-finger protein